MKILVLGLDGATPELLFGDERLVNVRRLMAYGCYGLLEGVAAPTPTLAWTCMATSQNPDLPAGCDQSSEAGRSREGSETVDSESTSGPTIWDQVMHEGKSAILVDVPPSSPPRAIDGVRVSFAIPAGSSAGGYTHPPSVYQDIVKWVGRYPLDVDEQGAEAAGSPGDQALDLGRDRFAVVRHLMHSFRWDYLHYVESGLVHLQSGIRDYYRFLDDELGSVLASLDENTIVLLVCLDAARRQGQAQSEAFVLAASNSPLQGEIEGAHMADLAPTLLDLAGYEIPSSMQGKSLVADRAFDVVVDTDLQVDEEDILRERLSGLGYL